MVDHASDSFIEGSTALMMLVEAALNGDEKAVDESVGVFMEHADKLVEVANLASANSVKMVRYVRGSSDPEPLSPGHQRRLGAGQQTQKQGGPGQHGRVWERLGEPGQDPD